jgi:hypothetical protein
MLEQPPQRRMLERTSVARHDHGSDLVPEPQERFEQDVIDVVVRDHDVSIVRGKSSYVYRLIVLSYV